MRKGKPQAENRLFRKIQERVKMNQIMKSIYREELKTKPI